MDAVKHSAEGDVIREELRTKSDVDFIHVVVSPQFLFFLKAADHTDVLQMQMNFRFFSTA